MNFLKIKSKINLKLLPGICPSSVCPWQQYGHSYSKIKHILEVPLVFPVSPSFLDYQNFDNNNSNLKPTFIKLVTILMLNIPVDTGRKLNVHKTLILRPVSTGKNCLGKLCTLVLFSPHPATLFKKRLQYRCFSVNFARFLRTPFFTEHLWWLLLKTRLIANPELIHLRVK